MSALSWMGYWPHECKAVQMKTPECGCSHTEQPQCVGCAGTSSTPPWLWCLCLRRKVTERERVRTVRHRGLMLTVPSVFIRKAKLSTPASLQEGVRWVKMVSSSPAISLHMGRGQWVRKRCSDAVWGAGEQCLGMFRVDLLS